MDSGLKAILAIVGSILTLATISVVLSRNANTAGVIQASSGGLSQLIGAATAPITGGGGGGSFGGGGYSTALNTFNSVLPLLAGAGAVA